MKNNSSNEPSGYREATNRTALCTNYPRASPAKLQFIFLAVPANQVFTFSYKSCTISSNRVGDLALSATGTGSCPEDEGCVPRWGHRTRCCILENLLYVATILGRATGQAVFAAFCPMGVIAIPSLPRRILRVGFFVWRIPGFACKKRRKFL